MKSSHVFALAALLLMLGSSHFVATQLAVSQTGQLAAVSAAPESSETSVGDDGAPLTSQPKTIEEVNAQACSSPGVKCTYKYGQTKAQPAGDCLSSKPPAGCADQNAIAVRQITSGVNEPAPEITNLTYTSSSCNITTDVGGGKCKVDASPTCPTAHRNDKTACFWTNCPGSCAGAAPGSSETSQQEPTSSLGDIEDELQGGGQKPITGLDGKQYPDAASCAAGGGCPQYTQGTSNTAVPGATPGQQSPVGDVTGAISDTGDTGAAANGGTNGTGNTNTSAPGAGATPTTGGNTSAPGTGSSNPVTSGGGIGQPSPTGAGLGSSGGRGSIPYQSLQSPSAPSPAFTTQPRGFFQRLADFVTGQPYFSKSDLRNTPEGTQSGQQYVTLQGQPQIVYVTQPANTDAYTTTPPVDSYRTIQQIASDIAAQTPVDTTIPRTDRYADLLKQVGGPNEVSTENKSFGRIQDLIVEDEALRALRVAEERGEEAKNGVFCDVDEAAEDCDMRREAKAIEVERETFVQELEKRVLPDSAIKHFLAVYDGLINPSPAPETYATSTLGLLGAQQNNPLAGYEAAGSGTNFVLWVLENTASATLKAVNTVLNLFI